MARALIVGSSGGIGSALSDTLVARGFDVTGLSRQQDGFDLRDPDKADKALARLRGSFDMVLVTTGLLAPPGQRPEKSLNQIDAEALADMLAVNTIGPALVLKHMPRLLPKTGRGIAGVLTARVGSIGDNRLGGWYAYRAAKAAANQLTRTAAIEIARSRKEAVVVALHPGTVDTAFTRDYASHAKVTPRVAAENLLNVIDGLTPAQTGGFFDWAGKQVPW